MLHVSFHTLCKGSPFSFLVGKFWVVCSSSHSFSLTLFEVSHCYQLIPAEMPGSSKTRKSRSQSQAVERQQVFRMAEKCFQVWSNSRSRSLYSHKKQEFKQNFRSQMETVVRARNTQVGGRFPKNNGRHTEG